MWHWLLVKLGIRTPWLDPDNAPPAFVDVAGHAFAPHEQLSCCVKCGGGRLHKIHTGQLSEV